MDGVTLLNQIGETEIDDNIYDYSGMKYPDIIKNFEKSYGKKSKGALMEYDVDNKCDIFEVIYEDGHVIKYKVKK